MRRQSLDKLILGHNQFFGISHLSSEKAIIRKQYFSEIENIINLIKYSLDKGIKGLMLSTHPRAADIAAAIKQDKSLSKNLNLYILLPYMAKYVKTANEIGMVRMMTDIFKKTSLSEKISLGLKAGKSVIKKEKLSQLEALIDIEMLPFKGLNIKAIFLHNALTDLIFSLKINKIINFFKGYVEAKYKTRAGFCTLSAGMVLKYFEINKSERPLIMAPFNSLGYQMNPSKKLSERLLTQVPCEMIAMSVLAAGQLKPDQVKNYLRQVPKIKSVVFGASTKQHIDEIQKYIKKAIY